MKISVYEIRIEGDKHFLGITKNSPKRDMARRIYLSKHILNNNCGLYTYFREKKVSGMKDLRPWSARMVINYFDTVEEAKAYKATRIKKIMDSGEICLNTYLKHGKRC